MSSSRKPEGHTEVVARYQPNPDAEERLLRVIDDILDEKQATERSKPLRSSVTPLAS